VGCAKKRADNYNPSATIHDESSCQFGVYGCTASAAVNFMAMAARDDGSCVFRGCTNRLASNYQPLANFDDGSCDVPHAGCTDKTAANFDTHAKTDDGSCIRMGCTDSTRIAFSTLATADDGSCGPDVDGCADSRAENYVPEAVGSKHAKDAASVCAIRGCTTFDALNFDPVATVDDNSCVRRRAGCTFSSALNYMPSATDEDGTCYVLGCTDNRAPAYNPLATADDGSCHIIHGCTDALASNVVRNATVDDGSCVYVGCMDSSALNFNPKASVGSGRCEHLPDGFSALVWPVRTAPVVYGDGGVRRYAFVSGGAVAGGAALQDGEMSPLDPPPSETGPTSLLLLGDPDETVSGLDGAGAVYLLHLSRGELSIAKRLPTSTGGRIDSKSISLSAHDHFGASVQAIADLDGDGIPELAIGAPGDDSGGTDAGAVYIVFLDKQANVRSQQKLTRPEVGGLFGTAVCARGGVRSSELPDLFVGAPGESGGQGAVLMVFLQPDGNARAAIKLAPSTWGSTGPELAASARFGASLAARTFGRPPSGVQSLVDLSSNGYELSVGAPGVGHEAGAVAVFSMGPRYIKSHVLLDSPETSTPTRFGSSVAYASDLDADGDHELVAGGVSSLYVLFTGSSNGTTVRRWSPIQHESTPSFTSARGVAVFQTGGGRTAAAANGQHQSSHAPLFVLEHAKGPPRPRAPTYRLKFKAHKANQELPAGPWGASPSVPQPATAARAEAAPTALLGRLPHKRAVGYAFLGVIALSVIVMRFKRRPSRAVAVRKESSSGL